METPKKPEKFWDRASNSYDKTEKKFEESYLRFIDKTSNYFKPEDTAMDIGCGTGLVCNKIGDKVKRVYAIDISSKMIEIAQSKTLELKIQNIEYIQTTIFDSRFESSSIDVITAFNILHLLDDTHAAISRLYELLKPGGLIISVTPYVGEKPLLKTVLTIGNKIGLIPDVKAFKDQALVRFFEDCKFEIIETGRLKQNLPLYFLIAKKRGEV